ncbi:MAG: thermonuclease family protein [Proteobacteria bacterium]|nr:thermonuclease family protein [Pseudomonadota bacterium]
MRKNGWPIASILICLMACTYWGCSDENSSNDADGDNDDCIIFGNVVCSTNETRCIGNVLQKCSINSQGCFYWERVQECSVCSNGACSENPPQPCSDGTCSENPPQPCSDGTCSENPPSCTNACTQNDVRCEGNVLQNCVVGENGCTNWKDEKTCSNGCESNQCVPDTIPKECDNVCNIGQFYCEGQTVMECQTDADGCPVEVEIEKCPESCSKGECVACSGACEVGKRICEGRTLSECVMHNGCPRYESVKKCDSSCYSNVQKCSEDLPTCKLVDGRKATILQWTDGDTLWVRAKSDGTCNDYEYTADSAGNYDWRNVRYDIRVHGIDAPECTKGKNNFNYYTCIKDTDYTNDNEPMGYESWEAASNLLAYKAEVTIYCEQTQKDGSCGLDATKKRFLAYIGYELNNASYDFSTEHARKGYAFSRTDFQCGKRKAICDAQSEAQAAKIGIWSLADTPEDVFGLMGSDKNKWLKYMPTRCKNAK